MQLFNSNSLMFIINTKIILIRLIIHNLNLVKKISINFRNRRLRLKPRAYRSVEKS